MADVLELWGGVECTVNRVGDRYIDQCALNRHRDRESDLELFAALGLRRLRQPVLWEHVAPERLGECDWRWHDARLARLRELGIEPIAGLVHHGSGPRYTNLLDDGFAPGLAAHAARTAECYPWIDDWTPVNEPNTTARFSALYGHWYPHAREEGAYWRALLNQVDATRLSMKAIRAVNPGARLIQTDDLGRTYATPELREQANFENVRRWMSWDLLCGRVTPGHPFWPRLAAHGLADRLEAIAADPCPPDIIGVNHYLTSERFLDHRLGRYPAHTHGGNDLRRYVDVEAVRVLDPPPAGLRGVLEETWHRYGLPIAITEVHNGCTREEQMRWIAEAWETAQTLCKGGADIRAVTAWSLLGSHDWDSLLTSERRSYECGVFDIRGEAPRPTAVAGLLRTLAEGRAPDHPVLAGAGWWRRPIRLEHPPVTRPAPIAAWKAVRSTRDERRPLLITGRTGTLGRALARACELRDIAYVLTDRRTLAIDDEASIERALDAHRPWAVINAAGWVRVDEAEDDRTGCLNANTRGALALARAAGDRGLPFVTFSSDLVFDGSLDRAYVESDPVNPLCVYGESKAQADSALLTLGSDVLIIRAAAFFSPHDPYNFAAAVLRELGAGRPFLAAADYLVSPTYVPDLVRATLDLLIDDARGLWHVSNREGLSWAAFAQRIAAAARLDAALVEPVPGETLGWRAPRPRQSALGTGRGDLTPSLDHALARFARSVEEHGAQAMAAIA